MKVCKECNQEKSLDAFYKHSKMLDGHLNKCIECVKERIKKHRANNIEKINAYDRERSKKPQRRLKNKEYAKSEKGKLAHKKSLQNYKTRHPLRYATKVMTGNAIRDGKLVRALNCSVCNSEKKIEGHHDDYTKPLDVRWLCEKCHKEWHKNNKPIYE